MKLETSEKKAKKSKSSEVRKETTSNKPKADRKKNSAGGKFKLSMIIALILVLVVGGGCAAGFFYISSIDTVYPNVTIDGIDVAGLDLLGMTEKLTGLGYGAVEDGSVRIILPLDNSVELKLSDYCSDTSPAEVASYVYETVLSGSASERVSRYFSCLGKGMALTSAISRNVDDSAISDVIDSAVREVNLALIGSSFDIKGDSITVIKGAGSISIDAEELKKKVTAQMLAGNFDDVVCDARPNSDTQLGIDEIYDSTYKEAADAYYSKETNKVVKEEWGSYIDKEEALKLWNKAEYGDKVIIPIVKTEPEIKAEELEPLLFRDKLSSCSTPLFFSNSNRVNNITKACASCNDIILMPGETFSYNEVLGPRNAENGYMLAGAYSGGETVLEYGGGICQVSSTVYNCALYANLQIDARTCHMFPVAYITAGLDATVSWGGPEFIFTNNRDYPILIKAWVENNNANVEFWGTDVDGSYVTMTAGTWYVYDETWTETVIGYKAQSKRHVYNADGQLISSTFEATSYYHYHDEDIKWPEEKLKQDAIARGETWPEDDPEPSPEATPEPTPEPTPEVTPEPTPEVTPEPTPEATPEPTPDATPEPPAEPTPNTETEPSPES